MSINDQRASAEIGIARRALEAERHSRIRAEQAMKRAKLALTDQGQIPEARIRNALREL